MTADGVRPGPGRRRGRRHGRRDACRATGLAVALLLTLLAVSNLVPVVGSAWAWTAAAVPAALLGCLAAAAGMLRRGPAVQMALLALSQLAVGPLMTAGGALSGHRVPLAQAWAAGLRGIAGSFRLIIGIDPPVGVADGVLMAVWTPSLWLGFLLGTCALASGRLMPLAMVPATAAGFAVSALLGGRTGWHRGIAVVLAVAVSSVWLSRRLRRPRPVGGHAGTAGRVLLAEGVRVAVLLLVPSIVGLLCAPLACRERLTLRDRVPPPPVVSRTTSPLSVMRGLTRERKDDTVLTVTGLPAGTPVRLAVMDRFDGSVWNLSDGADGSGGFRRGGGVRARTGDDVGCAGKGRFDASFLLSDGLEGLWLPLAGRVGRVSFLHDEDRRAFHHHAGLSAGLLVGGVRKGMSYRVCGTLPPVPSQRRIARARGVAPASAAPIHVPDSVSAFADDVAGVAGRGTGRTALALADRLRDVGWFSHGGDGEYPSPPGHGSRRVDALLSEPLMVGDSEQYASAMALAARRSGLDSRVVLGFLPKDADGGVDPSRTVRRRGRPVTAFRGRDAEAWVEVRLRGLGWVMVRPTPPETKAPEARTPVRRSEPDTERRQPPPPPSPREREDVPVRGTASGDGHAGTVDGMSRERRARLRRLLALVLTPPLAAVAVVAAVAAVRSARLASMRRRGPPADRILAGWRALVSCLRRGGDAMAGTRRDQARVLADVLAGAGLSVPAGRMAALADVADCAAFSARTPSDAQARAFWREVDALRRRWRRIPLPRRIRAGRRRRRRAGEK